MALNLPGIYVVVRGDFTQLEKDIAKTNAIIKKQATGISNAMNNAVRPEAINTRIQSMVSSLGTLKRASTVTGDTFDKLSVDLGDLSRNTGLSEKQLSSLQSRLLKTQAATAQEKALRTIGRSAKLTTSETRKLGRQFGLTKTQIDRVNRSLRNTPRYINPVSRSLSGLKNQVLALGSAWMLISGARAVIRIADQYALLDSKLKLVTEDSEEFSEVYQKLFDISQETGTSFANNAATFSNLSLALKDTNITSAETLQIFDDVNKSLVVAGTSTAEANSFMLQFKQALGSSKLAGDEFRGMMEANSYWGGLLAKALGTNVSGLRAMSKEGLLTTEVLLKAFPKMSKQINKDFEQIEKVITRAMTELSNAFNDVVSDTNRSTGSTASLATSISDLATTITENKEVISGTFTGLIKTAEIAVRGISMVGEAWMGLYNRSDAQAKGLSLSQAFGMSSEEIKTWLDESGTAVGRYKDKLKAVSDELTQISRVRDFEKDNDGWTAGAEERYQALLKNKKIIENNIELLNQDAKAEKELAKTIKEEQGEVLDLKNETSGKIIRIKRDERHEVLQIQKETLREGIKEETEQNVKAAEDIKDIWLDFYIGRADAAERLRIGCESAAIRNLIRCWTSPVE